MKGSHSAVSSPRRWSSSSSSSGAAGLLYPLLGACLWAAVVAYKPVIIVHGLFDSSGDFINLQRFINESHPGTNVTVIDLFDRSASLEPMWTQVEGFKAAIYPIMQNAADGVHFICYSQGGLVCRGILSTLSDHNVQSFISLSSPQAGQYGDTDYLKYLFPQFVKSNLYHICYTAIGQRISICNYWNDPHHRDLYVNSSDYLALLNSERANPNSTVTEWETAPAVAETPEIKLFGKWSTDDVQINDISLQDYIAVKEKYAKYLPHSGGRYAAKRFRKAQCPIVERLTNSMMMHGRNNGKKLMTVRIVKHAFEIIHLLTGENPLQVLVNAIINSGPREDSTRIGRAGTVRRQAVDVSPLRRVNQAIWLLCTGAREAAFRNIKTIAECLADELINAAKGSSNSYAIKKKDELERVAKSNR
ncbi:40S ribosomal protein S5 [Larimichthys crocea]|uniref:Uncharacterized protein n=1 Tax=Larimichthys crocea TaxID=215358 RepID=A0ACD3RJ06_LARCR|nr:40S ribosomal protein S5 [Larimichthys crocea]